ADGPSRQSLFTGLRPDSIQVFDDSAGFRRRRPDVSSLPQQFKQRGYQAVSVGRAFDDAASWNGSDSRTAEPSLARSWSAADAADAELHDGQTTQRAIQALERLSGGKFFLAVGLERPSLPFAAPESY